MNYYDELGVRRDAPVQEIRQAYRVMVRLLHPDTQSDSDLRLAAERQLNRLNAMVAVLSTPELRRAYDLQLDLQPSRRLVPAPPKPAPEFARWEDNASRLVTRAKPLVQLVFQHWSLILIGAVTCGAAVATLLLYSQDDALPESRGVETVRTAAAAPKATPAKPLPPRLPQTAVPTPQAARPAGIAFHGENPNAHVRPAAVAKASFETPHPVRAALLAGSPPPAIAAPAAPVPAMTPAPAAAASPAPVLFAGNWFYAVDLNPSKESTGYRAVYVELLLSERGEALAGNYRARYVIPDKAISPEVSFHLEGKVGPDRSARAQWSSANGAHGEAELNVNPSGIMDFHWWTVKISEKAGLTSGNARLVRQRLP